MKTKIDINSRFDSFQKYILYQGLDKKSKDDIKDIGLEHQLTFQELKQLTDMAVDFQMWEEPGIGTQWKQNTQSLNYSNKQLKENVFNEIYSSNSSL